MTISSTTQYGKGDEEGHEEARMISGTKIQCGVNNNCREEKNRNKQPKLK